MHEIKFQIIPAIEKSKVRRGEDKEGRFAGINKTFFKFIFGEKGKQGLISLWG